MSSTPTTTTTTTATDGAKKKLEKAPTEVTMCNIFYKLPSAGDKVATPCRPTTGELRLRQPAGGRAPVNGLRNDRVAAALRRHLPPPKAKQAPADGRRSMAMDPDVVKYLIDEPAM